MTQLPILYSRDTKGRVKQWQVRADGGVVLVSHGLKGMKIQHKATPATAKNVGKSNETSPEAQAAKEALSRWSKQKNKGYVEILNEEDALQNPMLAHDYRKQGHRITFPCMGQPKLDGVRCLVFKKGKSLKFMSRGNKEYPQFKHLIKEIELLYEVMSDNTILDGELYIHNTPLQDITGAVKKYKPLTDKLQFRVFDFMDLNAPELTNDARYSDLIYTSDFLISSGNFRTKLDNVRIERCAIIKDHEDAIKYHDKYVSDGYEGIMLRNLDGLYKLNQRSADLQKFKVFTDTEYLCTGVSLDKLGRGKLVFDTFTAALKGTESQKQHIADNPEEYIGKQITVQYQTLTKDGVPQFPVALQVREVDSNGKPLM